MRIGEKFRYGRIESFPTDTATVDGMTNWWWATRSQVAGLPSVLLDAGINSPAETKGAEPRVPLLALRSSTHKAGTDITPWEDIHRPDQGYSRYFGDNKVDSGKSAHETLGNRRLLHCMELHVGGDKASRLAAPPILIFETFPHQGRDKGQVVFHGVGVLTRAELVVQQDSATLKNFTNYRWDLVILDLAANNDTIDWAWLDARRDPAVSLETAVALAPSVWREWVASGAGALERLQRRVVKRQLVGESVQRPASGSKDEEILRRVYEFYEGRKHRFELLADFVTAEIFRAQGIDYRSGWITKGSGDGGVDFVGRVDLDPDGGFPGSRQVVLGQAKCEAPNRPTNGTHIARLAARLRRGWFGSYVTTSYFSRRVQEEIATDRYPVLLVPGGRLAGILRQHLLTNGLDLSEFLEALDSTFLERTGYGDPEQVLL